MGRPSGCLCLTAAPSTSAPSTSAPSTSSPSTTSSLTSGSGRRLKDEESWLDDVHCGSNTAFLDGKHRHQSGSVLSMSKIVHQSPVPQS